MEINFIICLVVQISPDDLRTISYLRNQLNEWMKMYYMLEHDMTSEKSSLLYRIWKYRGARVNSGIPMFPFLILSGLKLFPG